MSTRSNASRKIDLNEQPTVMDYSAKRQHLRAAFREGVRLMTSSGLEFATIEDISLGGIQLFCDHEMAIGNMMELQFRLSIYRDDSPIRLKNFRVQGIVARCSAATSGYSVGVRFTELAADQNEFLTDFLKGSEQGPF